MIDKNPLHEFRIHVPNFLKEVFDNNKLGGVLYVPANTLRLYLLQIAQRAAELNDPKLNAIMCQMALYDIADPESKDYNREVIEDVIKKKYL